MEYLVSPFIYWIILRLCSVLRPNYYCPLIYSSWMNLKKYANFVLDCSVKLFRKSNDKEPFIFNYLFFYSQQTFQFIEIEKKIQFIAINCFLAHLQTYRHFQNNEIKQQKKNNNEQTDLMDISCNECKQITKIKHHILSINGVTKPTPHWLLIHPGWYREVDRFIGQVYKYHWMRIALQQ